MRDDQGAILKEAGPSMPVEITGLTEVPAAGDLFDAVEDEKLAREPVSYTHLDDETGAPSRCTMGTISTEIPAAAHRRRSMSTLPALRLPNVKLSPQKTAFAPKRTASTSWTNASGESVQNSSKGGRT